MRLRSALRALAVLGALAGASLAVSSCGIPTQPSATPISSSQLQRTLPVTPEPISPCTKSGCTNVTVFFVAPGSRLRPFTRVVPTDAKLGTVIRALLSGPTQSERATGISTALASNIRLNVALETTKKNVVTVTFTTQFGTLSGTKWVLGVAQVVYTVSYVRPGAGVIFEIDGAQSEVPLATGKLWTAPVHESQYATLLTTSAATTTTRVPETTQSTTKTP